jgi:hypothetical protein
MNFKTNTISSQDDQIESQFYTTVSWNEHSVKRVEKIKRGPKSRILGLALYLATSVVTAIPDPWIIEKRKQNSTTTISIFQPFKGRMITFAEAIIIGQQILEEAERKRLEYAQIEAARGIQWEDQ